MKNIKAFLAALLLFCVSVVTFHVYSGQDLPDYNLSYGTWIKPSKFASTNGLKQMLSDEDAMPVFGSSELRHGQRSKFHANTIFENTDMDPVFIGQAGYQSLTHAITLGALGDTLENRKAVLIVSEQWFKKNGVKEDAFGSAFSEDNYISFLKNDKISDETKEYVMSRAESLTCENDVMNERISNDNAWYTGENLNLFDQTQAGVHSFLVEEKSTTRLLLDVAANKVGNRTAFGGMTTTVNAAEVSTHGSDQEQVAANVTLGAGRKELTAADWKNLYCAAEKRGNKIAGGNDFGMCNSAYTSSYKEIVDKGHAKKPSYTTDSVEFDDLECFLKICQEENIEPLVVILPFNGYWYDFMKFDSSEREPFYDKIKEISDQYGAEYADLSGNEYTQYYFEDNSHLALKGLVDLNEQIYDFYRKD